MHKKDLELTYNKFK